MSIDFTLNYIGAFSSDSQGHYRLLKPRDRVERLTPLLTRLVQEQSEPDEFQSCPICEGQLHVSFYTTGRTPNLLDINTGCATCNIRVTFKANHVPSWAKQINLFERLRELKRGDQVKD
jgi:hypothetical protein